MKKFKYVVLIILSPMLLFSQQVEVDGEFLADSIDVQLGQIKNVADPVSAQDASTKEYVDNLLIDFGISIGRLGIQGLLDSGFSPLTIINNGASIVDFIGLNYVGGIIFYMDPSEVGTGLVSAASDQTTFAQWGCIGTLIDGADDTGIGSGNQNTSDIILGCTTIGIVAEICTNLSLNGYTDWFLPSKDELNEMYTKIGPGAAAPNTNIGNFSDSWYWSSSEYDDDRAWSRKFSDGSQFNRQKYSNLPARAIRAF